MGEVKQVIVMRADLGMRKGKMIAQGSHSSMAWMSKILRNYLMYSEDITKFAIKEKTDMRSMNADGITLTWEQLEWIQGPFTKICVRVDSEEELMDIYNKVKEAGLTVELITDAGLTEFHGVPTKTCLAIGPHESSKIDVITGHLKLL